MRQRHAFRPCVFPCVLEERVVPSQGQDSTPQTVILNLYERQFRQAFDDLQGSIAGIAASTLFSGDGQTAASHAASYQSQITGTVQGVNADLSSMLALSPLARFRLTPALQQSLVGPGPDSLASRLSALSSSPTADALQSSAAAVIADARDQALARLDAFASPSNPLRQRVGGSDQPPRVQIHASYVRQFKQVFSGLATNYSGLANDLLFKTGASDDVSTLSTLRPRFDAQIQGSVDLVASELTSMLALLPRTSSGLASTIQQELLGGSDSLLARLDALANPTDLAGSSAQSFGSQAARIITDTFHSVVAKLNAAFGMSRANPGRIPANGSGVQTGSGQGAGTGSSPTAGTGGGSPTAGTGSSPTQGTGSTAAGSTVAGQAGQGAGAQGTAGGTGAVTIGGALNTGFNPTFASNAFGAGSANGFFPTFARGFGVGMSSQPTGGVVGGFNTGFGNAITPVFFQGVSGGFNGVSNNPFASGFGNNGLGFGTLGSTTGLVGGGSTTGLPGGSTTGLPGGGSTGGGSTTGLPGGSLTGIPGGTTSLLTGGTTLGLTGGGAASGGTTLGLTGGEITGGGAISPVGVGVSTI